MGAVEIAILSFIAGNSILGLLSLFTVRREDSGRNF